MLVSTIYDGVEYKAEATPLTKTRVYLGHYIENTSETEDLVWIEIYKSDRVADISLAQWLALTPANIVSSVLKLPVDVVEKLKKEKQVLIA